MSRVLVTGGAGFIGSHLVDALVKRNYQASVVDDLSSGYRKNIRPGVRLYKLDIRSPRMAEVFREVRPQFVLHLAAQKNVRTSMTDPLFDAAVNIMGSLNVIQLASQYKVKKFIFSSTGGALYGDGVPLPTPETVAPRPTSPYGIAKFTIEQYLDFYRQTMKLNSVSLRYANVYGPRQDPEGEAGVVAIFARQLRRRKPLLINGHGRQTRDYVYVTDVVRANLLAMKKHNVMGEINIGTGQQTSVNTLARSIQRASKVKVPVQYRPSITGEVGKSAVAWKRAKQQLHWQPETSLHQGLLKTWASAQITL